MRYQQGDVTTVHTTPIWRSRANFIFMALDRVSGERNEWEQLWGQKLSPNRCILCCIPFFLYDVALGDEVELSSDLVLTGVVRRSGQVTFRVWFGDGPAATRTAVDRDIQKMEVLTEWSSPNLLAISVDVSKAKQLADYLHNKEEGGYLSYENGDRAIDRTAALRS